MEAEECGGERLSRRRAVKPQCCTLNKHQPRLPASLSKYGKTNPRRSTMDYRSFKRRYVTGRRSYVYRCQPGPSQRSDGNFHEVRHCQGLSPPATSHVPKIFRRRHSGESVLPLRSTAGLKLATRQLFRPLGVSPDVYLDELRQDLELRTGRSFPISKIWRMICRRGCIMKKVRHNTLPCKKVSQSYW